MTSKERSYLKGLASKLTSIVQIGKQGLTPDITAAVDEALEARELIKVSVLNNCDEDIREMAERIKERTHSEIILVIGSKIVFYRKSKKKPIIDMSGCK